MVRPPSGTVTFLFTDVEGSTRLWEEDPEATSVLLARHDQRFRDVIELNEGFVVKATGDGFHAAFARAGDAVTAAEQLQAASADLPGLKVRIGINTGEAQERDGDYFGTAVNRAARLMAAGHGGQVLLAGVTADLVPGLTLRNLGEHRLRDLASPVVVWQLGSEEFPPLSTLDDLPGNLPAQRTSFIGRAEEVQQIARLIETERLVTLTGPGGVGKTRLALQVAAEAAPDFRDGAWFASLASLAESALVATTVLDALDVSERHREAALDTLCAWTSNREALVVIDNCEHLLVEVARVVDRLLDASPSLRVLVTSQEPLAVRGEHLWAVAPLSARGGLAADSVELFVDRARMARADFTLNADNARAVVEICERLDHVPLALELAAARMRGMSPSDIAHRLDQRLRLLTSSDRLAPDRQRTLDAAMRWSYELLDETQRRVFDRLSVFVGPFSVEAAGAVVAGDGVEEWQVLDSVLALVDKSLVTADETTTGTRYRLLETTREFGNGNLAAARADDVYRARHGDFYADYVLSRQPQLHGRGDQVAVGEVEPELENIRLALRRAADDLASSRFEQLCSALYRLWIGRGRLSEGATWARALRDRAPQDAVARVSALGFAANVANGSDLALARELAEAAIRVAAANGLGQPPMATAVLSLGSMMQGDIAEAVATADRVVAAVDAEPSLFTRTEALVIVTAVLTVCGALDRLEPLLPVLSDLVEQGGSDYQKAAYANSMAPVIHLTDPVHAREYLERGYECNSAIGNYHALSTTTMFLALHELRAGRLAPAAEWARQSIELAVEHSPSFVAQAIDAGIAIVKRLDPTEAAVLLGALRSHRARMHQAGSPPEIDAEARYEVSLRRALGDQFDVACGHGSTLGEAEMVAQAYAQLDLAVQSYGPGDRRPT